MLMSPIVPPYIPTLDNDVKFYLQINNIENHSLVFSCSQVIVTNYFNFCVAVVFQLALLSSAI